MKLIPDDRLYELLRIEKLWNLVHNGGYIPDVFWDTLVNIGYFEKEKSCIITKLMNEYEDYPGE